VKIIERKEALELGLTTYYTGRECKHGHIAKRNTKTGVCSICAKGQTKAWRLKGEGDKYKASYSTGKPLPDKSYLDKILKYDSETGKLYWKARDITMFKDRRAYSVFKSNHEGKEAGHKASSGYVDIRVGKSLIKSHRIVWKMSYGEDPLVSVDHVNGDRSDNRLDNLRLATSQENSRNSHSHSKTGYKGVTERQGNFIVQWCVRDTNHFQRGFKDKVTAAKYYDKVVYELYGEFAKLNFPEDYEEIL